MINSKREGNKYKKEHNKTHDNHDQDVKGNNYV